MRSLDREFISKCVPVMAMLALLTLQGIVVADGAAATPLTHPRITAKVAIYSATESQLSLSGDQITTSRISGGKVVTIRRPGEACLKHLFQTSEGDIRSPGLAHSIVSHALELTEMLTLELDWPRLGPQYYLEAQGADLYRRVQLAEKEGYTVSLHPTGTPPNLTVETEIVHNRLTSGKYDETIKAFVGRPDFVKTVCTTSAPISAGEKTLVIWQTPPVMDPSVGKPYGSALSFGYGGSRGGSFFYVQQPRMGVAALLEVEASEQWGAAKPVEFEIACTFAEVAPGAFPAKEALTTKSTAAWLAKAASEGKATVIRAPHITCLNNQWAELSFYPTIRVATTEYDQHGQRITSETEQRDMENFLRVKPVLLEDGKIAIDLEIIFKNVLGNVAGPEGQIMPILATQEFHTSVTVPDRQTVTIQCGRVGESYTHQNTPLLSKLPIIGKRFRSKRAPAETEAGVEGEPRDMLITITPKVLEPVPPQTPDKPEADKEPEKTE